MAIEFVVNPRSFSKEIIASASGKNNATQVLNSLYIGNKPLKSKFEELKKQMIKEFISHPVTKEILGGPAASNTSGTLRGYGNLYSFIGFTKGTKPIDPILRLLEQTNLNVSRINPRGRINIAVTLPSRDDIFAVTPLPWASGLSWAQRIEQGMSGFGEYLNTSRSQNSRSSAGIQTESSIRPGGFSNIPYISSFINRWKAKFSRMDKA